MCISQDPLTFFEHAYGLALAESAGLALPAVVLGDDTLFLEGAAQWHDALHTSPEKHVIDTSHTWTGAGEGYESPSFPAATKGNLSRRYYFLTCFNRLCSLCLVI